MKMKEFCQKTRIIERIKIKQKGRETVWRLY